MSFVARDTALDVLRRCNIVVVERDNGDVALSLSAADVPEVHKLPAQLGRHMVHYLARRFGVPVHIFWNPEQLASWLSPPPSSGARTAAN